MKFADFVCFDTTVPELESTQRDDAIGELVKSLADAGKLGKADPDQIITAMIKRENEASTGMGKGIAVPHVKHKDVKKLVATVGQSSGGIDFSALDKQPVYSVILLVSPAENSEEHLQAMESIFKHLQKERFRKFLRQAKTSESIEDLLREADENDSL